MTVKILYLYISLFILCISCADNKTGKLSEEFRFQRGVNISHWLSQLPGAGQDRSKLFTEEDIKRIAGFNYDHIRLPVDEEVLWDEQGNKYTENFKLRHSEHPRHYSGIF